MIETLTRLPALIDPHVHFRTPGAPHKEDWISGAKAAIAGGVTTVFDMPNTKPATITHARLQEKIALIDAQLKEAEIPLHYSLFFGADKNHFAELSSLPDHTQGGGPVVGVKVFMGSSTGDLLMDDAASLDELFKRCAERDLLVAIHGEDDAMIRERMPRYQTEYFSCHSEIRAPIVAATAIETAIALTRKYGTRLYVLHVGSRLEIEATQKAKAEGLPVWVEIAPHYLFLDTMCYAHLKGKAQMNPPVRSPQDRAYLWEAIAKGFVDTIGSDHAPHLLTEKEQAYGHCPSGVPGVQTTLPLLLNAYHEGKITLEKIVELTHTNPKKIFNLPDHADFVLVDLNLEKVLTREMLYSKAGWSPYEGMRLKGWPVYTVIGGQIFDVTQL